MGCIGYEGYGLVDGRGGALDRFYRSREGMNGRGSEARRGEANSCRSLHLHTS